MKVLIADLSVIDTIGGGQTVFQRIIALNPSITFYCLTTGTPSAANIPDNVRLLPYKPTVTGMRINTTEQSIQYNAIAMARNIASSAAGLQFDVIDVPDYLTFAAYLPAACAEFGVRYGKIIQSLHGRISITTELSWEGLDIALNPAQYLTRQKQQRSTADLFRENVHHLEQLEDDGLRVCQGRYAISKWYRELLMQRVGNPSCALVHPLLFLEIPEIPHQQTERGRPTMLFAGRLERRKRPDFFLDLAWFAHVKDMADVVIAGADESFRGQSVAQLLGEHARQRRVPLQYLGAVPRDKFLAMYANTVVVLPSQFESFGLVALEGLLRGALVALPPTTGVFHFLREEMPDIAFCQLDLRNITGSAASVRRYFEHFSEISERNLTHLRAMELGKKYSPESHQDFMVEVYEQSADHAVETVERYRDQYRQYLSQRLPTMAHVKSVIKNHLPERGKRAVARAYRYASALRYDRLKLLRNTIGKRLVTMEGIPAYAILLNLYLRLMALRQGSLAITDEVRAKANEMVKLGRAKYFRQLADQERQRGNELLAVVYDARLARWTGDHAQVDLDAARAALCTGDFNEVADILPYVTGHRTTKADDEWILSYLCEQTKRDFSPDPGVGITRTMHHTNAAPRVSILVSLYQAHDKLGQFIDLLSGLDYVAERKAEVVFVDSGSPTVQFSPERLEQLREQMDFTHVRTSTRETIQAAWNRALAVARAPYICCLGVDEMLTVTALSRLSEALDQHPDVDWVTGSTMVVNADRDGVFLSDVMPYDRAGMTKMSAIVDGCYLAYVGAMYRKSVHARYGLYDPSFRAAGDTEFMHRVLPYINFLYLDENLGAMINYPEERTTCHPRAELEDLRAKYLFWTTAGLQYLLHMHSEAELLDDLRQVLAFRMSYSYSYATDIDLAVNLSRLLMERDPASTVYQEIADMLLRIQSLLRQMDRWDGKGVTVFQLASAVKQLKHLRSRLSKALDTPVEFQVFNDVRYTYHANVWSIPPGSF